METKSEKLTLWERIGYGMGDIYGGGVGVVVNFYYLIFLTDVIRLSPGLAGTVILISRVYDSITDPIEGIIADRTRTKLGRRRPYLLAGIPLIFLSFFAMFYPYRLDTMTARFIIVLLSHLFFATTVSIVMLNYNALQAEITLDYHERATLSSIRIFFSSIASLAAAVAPPEIVKAFPDVYQGYIVMALIFGAFFALPFIGTFSAVKERPEFQQEPEPFNLRNAFIVPFQNRTFVYTLGMYLFAFVALDTVSNVVAFFLKYHLLRGGEISFVSGTLLISQMASLPFFIWLSRRTSKVKGYMLGLAIWAITMPFSILITSDSAGFWLYIFAAAVGLGVGGVVVMMYSIFPDIPDVDELASGERREGVYSALVTFVRKLSSALAIFAVSQAIAFAGYIPPIEEVIDGATQLIEQPQSDAFLMVLRVIFMVLPVVLLGIAFIFASRFPLTPEIHARLTKYLEAVRKDEEPEEDGEELKKLLVGGKAR